MEKQKMNNDPVNHPAHYMSSSGIESIDVIQAFTEGLTGVEAFCAGNVLKYVIRYKKKNGLQDLKKAQWYLNRVIDMYKNPNPSEPVTKMEYPDKEI